MCQRHDDATPPFNVQGQWGFVLFFLLLISNDIKFSKDTLKLTVQTVLMLWNIYFKWMLFFWTLYSAKNPEKKCVSWYKQYWTDFNTEYISWAGECVLEWYLIFFLIIIFHNNSVLLYFLTTKCRCFIDQETLFENIKTDLKHLYDIVYHMFWPFCDKARFRL